MNNRETALIYTSQSVDKDNEIERKSVIVVGSGPVGMRLTRKLLDLMPNIKLTIFGNEPYQPYDRAQLTSLLAGEINREKIDIPLPNNEVHPNFSFIIASIHQIDKENKTVIDRQGNFYSYDILVIATGARAHVPNVKGVDLKSVYTFRNLKDTESLYARITRARSIVVIGGGLLGLEAAKGLAKFNTQVVLVHQGPHLMNRQLDEIASDKLAKKMTALGIRIIVNSGAREFISKNGRVTAVKTRSGEVIPCDTVLLCTGIQPNVELARNAKIKVSTGIIVNDRLETSEPDIYAIGECCEHRGITYGLVAPGYEQADAVAKVINDLKVSQERQPSKQEENNKIPYAGSLTISRLKVLGENVCSMGKVVELPKRPFQSEAVYQRKSKGIYRKIVIYKNQIIGAAGVGVWPDVGRVQDAYRNNDYIRWRQKIIFRLVGSLWLTQTKQDIKEWPSNAIVCQCNGVSQGQIISLINSGIGDLESIQSKTMAGTTCGSCKPLLASAINQPEYEIKEKSTPLIAFGSFSVFAALLFLAFYPAQETSASVQSIHWFEKIWNDKFWKQVTGFSLLGLTVLGLLMSVVKRFKLNKLGSFSFWRIMHVFIGLICASVLILHTGFHAGNNLNRLLFLNFTSVLLVGIFAGIVVSFGNKFTLASSLSLRKMSTWMHIFIAWPLPVLLGVHILSVYYF